MNQEGISNGLQWMRHSSTRVLLWGVISFHNFLILLHFCFCFLLWAQFFDFLVSSPQVFSWDNVLGMFLRGNCRMVGQNVEMEPW